MRPALVVLIGVLGGGPLVDAGLRGSFDAARRDADAAKKGSQFLLGVGDFLVHWFMWAIGPVERGDARALGTTPDHMNAAGLAVRAAPAGS